MELLEFASETLHQALAFIDASAASEEQDQLSSSGCSPESPEPLAQADVSQNRLSASPTAVRKRKRIHAKSELERLRHDVQTLEKTLTSLKCKSLRSNEAASAPNATSATQLEAVRADNELEALWMDLAVAQNRRRQQSEATNRQLKRALAKHLKVAKYLEALIARRTLAEVSCRCLAREHVPTLMQAVY